MKKKQVERKQLSPSVTILTLACALAMVACGDDDGAAGTAGTGGEGGSAGSSGNGGSGGNAAPLYAVTTTVFDDTNAATYVQLVNSLDAQEIDLTEAREFAGWSSVDAHGDAVYVGDGEAPEIRRYPVTDLGALAAAEAGTVSFSTYGLSDASLSFNTFVDPHMAHLALDQTSRILWDPTDMAILGVEVTPEVAAERDGLEVTAANFQGRVVRDDGVFQPFFWHDEDWYAFHPQSQIGIYTRDGKLDTLLDVPCPALQIATQDEQGNLYVSGMVDTIPYQLKDPSSTLQRCVVRIDAGANRVAEGWPRSFEELTDGRPTGVFHYLKDGIGILTVYHVENADPTAEDFLDSWFQNNWGLWLVDLEAWEAEPIEAWPLGSSNIFFSRVGDRLFVHNVAADFTSTTISEIAVDGTFEERITVPGYAAYPLLRVR